jgi:iron complex outermembrane receptor protein
MGRWTRTFSERSNTALKVYYDRFSRDIYDLGERIDTFDVDFQHNVAFGSKHHAVWGLGYRLVADGTDSTNTTPVQFNPIKKTVQLFSAFAQDEITLVKDRLRLTLGAKLEHNDFSGFVTQPNFRIWWNPGHHQTVWGSIARAVRAAARTDEDLRVNLAAFPGPQGTPVIIALFGNPAFQSERVTAYELGYRAQPGKRLSLDVATFYNVYDRLRTSEPGTPFFETDPLPAHVVSPLVYQNLMRGETYGAEASLNLTLTRYWRLAGSYSFLRMNLHLSPNSRDSVSESTEGNSPQHQFQLHSYLKLPRNLELDAALYRVSRLPSLQVPPYTRVDVRLGWRFSESGEFSFAGQNLLNARHAEFGGLEGIITQQVTRSAYGKLTWKF